MSKNESKIKTINNETVEPRVYHRISDAMESSHSAQMKDSQNKIIMENTQRGHGLMKKKGSYQSRRRWFRLYRSLSFIDHPFATGGYLSCALSSVSLFLLIKSLLISIRLRGNVGTKVGWFALFSFIFAFFSFIIGLKSFKEEDKSYLLSKIGSYFSLTLILFWIVMYLRGILIR